MVGLCMVGNSVNNQNFCMLNIHLQFPVVEPLVFVLKVSSGRILHDMAKLCLGPKMSEMDLQIQKLSFCFCYICFTS